MINSISFFFSSDNLEFVAKQDLITFKDPRNLLKCSKAFSLRLKAPRIAKTKGNIIAILIRVRSIL